MSRKRVIKDLEEAKTKTKTKAMTKTKIKTKIVQQIISAEKTVSRQLWD